MPPVNAPLKIDMTSHVYSEAPKAGIFLQLLSLELLSTYWPKGSNRIVFVLV